MKTCCVSVKALYDKFGNYLPSGNYIRVSCEGDYYYDLYDKYGNLVYTDGEECEVVYELSSRMYKFTNRDGEFDAVFYLTKEEMDYACIND